MPTDVDLALARTYLREIERLAADAYALLAPDTSTHVPAGADLQAAINAAKPGDRLVLEAGATWLGNFTSPVKSDPRPITLTTSATLPARRIGRDDAPMLATLRSPNALPALKTTPGSHGWVFDGIAFACGASTGPIVALGDGVTADASLIPRGIVIDRALIVADATAKNGLEANAADLTLRRSSVLGVKLQRVESHAVVIWNSPGPLLIEDSLLEAGACGFFVGGAKPSIPGLIPSDITFTRNLVTRPLEMQTQTGWGVKNLFELKNAQRVTARGNIFERNWVDGQSGYAITLTVRANSPSAPWTTIRDVAFEHNTVRDVAAVVNVLGLDNQTDPSTGIINPSTPMQNVVLWNNLVYGVDRQRWASPVGELGNGVFLLIDEAPRQLRVENNTVQGHVTGNILNAVGRPIPEFVFRQNVVQKLMAPYQTYGVKGNNVNEGNPTFARYFPPDLLFAANVLAGCTPATYSTQPDNLFPTVAALHADFVDAANHNYRLRTLPGGCDLDALEQAQAQP